VRYIDYFPAAVIVVARGRTVFGGRWWFSWDSPFAAYPIRAGVITVVARSQPTTFVCCELPNGTHNIATTRITTRICTRGWILLETLAFNTAAILRKGVLTAIPRSVEITELKSPAKIEIYAFSTGR
jgi:hypothetical protein